MRPSPLSFLRRVLPLVTLGWAQASVAQSILQVEELDRNGNLHRLSDTRNVVDINSVLRIHIDRDLLRPAVVQSANDSRVLDSLLTEVSALNEVAGRGLDISRTLEDSLTTFLADPNPDVDALQHALTPAASAALGAITLLPVGDPWRDTLNRLLEENEPADDEGRLLWTYRLVFETARDKAAALNAEVDRELASQQVYVRLGAWLGTVEGNRPIHVPGFDDLPPGERYFVNPWQLSMTDEQRQRFEEQRAVAERINQEGTGVLVDLLQGSVRQRISDQLDNVAQCADEVVGALNTLVQDSPPPLASLLVLLNDVQVRARTYSDLVRQLTDRYRNVGTANVTSPSFPLAFQGDLQAISIHAEGFLAASDQLRTLSTQADLQGALSQQMTAAVQSSERCSRIVTHARAALVAVRDLIGGVDDVRDLASENFEMSDKVLRVPFGEVVEQVEVALVNTGVREEEDVVVLKLVSGREGEPERELAFRQVTLMRVLPHFKMAPALVFAYRRSEPATAGQEAVSGTFQAAPSYSVLIKGGGRRNVGFRRLFDPGVGLNVATLDFDNDDDLEVGLGLVASLFRDYLQGGVGFNMQANEAYGFFGVNLPIASLNVKLPP